MILFLPSAVQILLVTERIVGSLHNVLTHFQNMPGARLEARTVNAVCLLCVQELESVNLSVTLDTRHLFFQGHVF